MDCPKLNLHIHSTYSDGRNSVREIVERALRLELNHIAITDHFSNSWKAQIIPTLNNKEKIDNYCSEISEYQKKLNKNKSSLRVYKGIEIDLGSSDKFIKRYIQPDKFQIILFEYLESMESIAFIKNIYHYWKKSGVKKKVPLIGLAHFDPAPFIYNGLDILISFLKEYNIYFEFNYRYSAYYSRKNQLFFEKLMKNSIPVAIGCDSHGLSDLNNIMEPFEMIEYYNLKKNLQMIIDFLNKGIELN